MVHNVIRVVVQADQHSVAQLVFAIVSVKHITPLQKHVRTKQTVRHVQMDCVQVVHAKMTLVQVVRLNHVRLI